MENFSLIELYGIRKRMIKENYQDDELLQVINEAIQRKESEILEDTSATGGPSVGGMGAVVSAQPSGLAGATIGTNWASQGGTTGSGDVSVPYNPSGANRVFHQVSMGKSHGPRTGKKSREKKIDLKSLRDMFNKRKSDSTFKRSGEKKVMDFNDFQKDTMNTVKKNIN